ncbi:MAG: hypothetical protein V1755_13795 [Chloroflexota bacterium]
MVLLLCLLACVIVAASWALASCQAKQAEIADSRASIERVREQARADMAQASQEGRTERLQSFLAAVLALTVVAKQADALNQILPSIVGVILGAALMLAALNIKRS